MALTRKFLSALGIEADKIDEIIDAHTETVNALKEERDTYKADAEKLPGVQTELDALKEAAEKNGDNPYKAQYDDLKAEYDKYKEDVEAERTDAKKKACYTELLRDAGVSEKRIGSVLKVSDFAKYELTKEGTLKDSDAITEAIKKEWADFIVTEEKKGAETNNPPAGGSGSDAPSRAAQVAAKFYKQTYGEQPKGE